MKLAAVQRRSSEMPAAQRQPRAEYRGPEAAVGGDRVDSALEFLLASVACAVPVDLERYQASRRARSRSSARRGGEMTRTGAAEETPLPLEEC